MPELPDVEMARRLLRRLLLGATITRAESSDRVITRPLSPAALARTLVGGTVRAVDRRGKWLRIVVDDGRLFSHLGMTGDWVTASIDAAALRFERARIDVEKRGKAQSARYVDARRFGRLVAAREDIPEWQSLGPDPMSDGLDAHAIGKELGRIRRSVKEALMDQTVLAGIGNILATEALWHAGIDPRSPANALTRADVKNVVRGLRTAIRRQIDSRERARDDVFFAYGKEGTSCRRCGTELRRIVLGGRGTTFCTGCQVRRKVSRTRMRPLNRGEKDRSVRGVRSRRNIRAPG
jgi:formamidopyrimidine-DNA glycosylase